MLFGVCGCAGRNGGAFGSSRVAVGIGGRSVRLAGSRPENWCCCWAIVFCECDIEDARAVVMGNKLRGWMEAVLVVGSKDCF